MALIAHESTFGFRLSQYLKGFLEMAILLRNEITKKTCMR